MDYVAPAEVVSEALRLGERKARLGVRDMLIRGGLAGAFLGYATSLVFMVLSQGLPPVVGALLFPVGFVILVLLGLELATGNFALLPPALLAGRISKRQLIRNWTWVYAGNLIGSLLYAGLFYLAITNFGSNNGGAGTDQITTATTNTTTPYAAMGTLGWCTAFVKGMLCNWMGTVGEVARLASRSRIGNVVSLRW